MKSMLTGRSEYDYDHDHDHGHHQQQQEMAQWARNPMAMDRRWKANIEVAPNCPRCASTNTKFCYYNNYSLSQPRYFCKGCRRYWTKGGSLRNVPVGGSCRKRRRAKSSAKMTTTSMSSNSYSSSTSTSGDDKSSSSNGMDIDLASVFAKFLNYNTTTITTNLEAGDNDDDVDNYMEMQRPVDHINHQDKQLQMQLQCSMEGFPQVIVDHGRQQEENLKQLISPADNVASAFDQVAQDIFWSNISNLTTCWQLPVSEFEDEFNNLNNQLLLSDDWSCFDHPPSEIFSRP
ncbi:hypothetical protein Ancab_036311 [Ancistrocladus abbreviatus]